jgi:hypothetical protein
LPDPDFELPDEDFDLLDDLLDFRAAGILSDSLSVFLLLDLSSEVDFEEALFSPAFTS